MEDFNIFHIRDIIVIRTTKKQIMVKTFNSEPLRYSHLKTVN